MNNKLTIAAPRILDSLRELSEWMLAHTGPSDGTMDMLTRASAALELVDDIHTPDFLDDLAKDVDAAVRQEREACAVIAERNAPEANLRGDYRGYDIMRSIAVAIRAHK